MNRFAARANIDHYIGVLNDSDLAPHDRGRITELLIAEEDKLGHDLEQLQFAEDRTAKSLERLTNLKRLRERFNDGSTHRAQADRALANFEAIHQLMEQFCRRMREKANSRGL
jgi:DNA-binding MltR family transcriptional regulator